MTSTYPSAIDQFPEGLPLGETAMNDSRIAHAQLHRKTSDAIVAVQETLGESPGGSYSTVSARLNAASYQGHQHAISNVTGLQAALNSKAQLEHPHSISEIVGLQDALNSRSGTGHTHPISGVVGLQTELDSKAGLSTEIPEGLGSPARGTSTRGAREDHVHPLPSLTELGAASRTTSISAGTGLTGGGALSANRTISANLPPSGGRNGTASTLARSDHNHDGDYPRLVVQTLGTPLPPAGDYPAGTLVVQY